MLPDGIAEGAGAHAVDDRGLVQSSQRRIVQVSVQDLQRLLDGRTAQVERGCDGPRPLQLQTRGGGRN